MPSYMYDERKPQPTTHEPIISMQYAKSLNCDNDMCDLSSDYDNVNGIDITKSLYHLRLHGFDMVEKNHEPKSGASSPTRIACITPAVSPVHDVYSYRKRPSQHLPQGNLTPTICSRPLSPCGLEVTPTRARQLPSLPQKEAATTKCSIDVISAPTSPNISTSNFKSFPRVLPITITDGEDEFEVMLESSVSSDEYSDNSDYHVRNESSILDSPQSLPSVTQKNNITTNDDDGSVDDGPVDDGQIAISPQTPARSNFCGISSWCDTSTTYTTGQHVHADDGSLANSFQLHHRSSSEWFVCPASASGCCIATLNDTDATTNHLAIVQNMLQNHICMSLGDNIETLCWQKSASSVIAKSSGSVHVNSTPLPSIGEDSKGIKIKHRRISTLPMHRRVDEFALLQYNLHPFDSVLNRNTKPHALSKSQSFHYSPKHRTPQIGKVSTKSKNYPNSDVGLVSTEWECGVLDFALAFESNDAAGCSHKQRSSSAAIGDSLTTPDSLVTIEGGYESDPEIFCRIETAERLTDDNPKPIPSQPSRTMQEFLNERNTFIWHTSNSKSIAVHVWIELGQQLNDSLVLPKLCWKPILSTLDNTSESKRTNIVGGIVSSIELLSIYRIRQVTRSDREQYPFAQTQRLFSIQSNVDNYDTNVDECPPHQQQNILILEARSIADRIRYSNLLKLTVSNLATKFITNDPSTFTMFFHNATISDMVN